MVPRVKCKSEVVVCSEGVNDVRVGLRGYIEVGVEAAKGGIQWCKSEEVVCPEVVK